MHNICSLPNFKLLMTGFAGLLSLSVVAAVSACPIPLPTMEVDIKNVQLQLEIAATPEARKCGLSKRQSLPENQGMLFVEPKPKMLSFWMVNTQLQLSIAFLDDDGCILSIQNMKPDQTQERYRSPDTARYAIEVNQGWFAKHHVEVGDVIELHLPVTIQVQ